MRVNVPFLTASVPLSVDLIYKLMDSESDIENVLAVWWPNYTADLLRMWFVITN